MALDYTPKTGLDAVMPILDEYVVWYGKLVRAYLEEKPLKEAPPLVFAEWMATAELPENIADRARRIHQGMVQAARSFAMKYTSRTEPPLAEYNELSRYYEEFIHFMHRLEVDLANENSGFDKRTGLRSIKLMQEDIAREMERRARRGNPFSIAIIKINHFKDEWRSNPQKCLTMIRGVSDRIKESLRSFDDAYYMGDEYFVLSLKHADTVGAQAALNRLNNGLSKTPVFSPDNPNEEMSLTSVFYEPAEGDKLDNLLVNLKNDLGNVTEKAAVIQYNDVSPLKRYLHSIDGDK